MVRTIIKGKRHSIIIIDSVAHMDANNQGNIIVCGSHGGESAAKHLLQFKPGGALFNDAGKGKGDAGIMGLSLFDATGIPAATVDAFSARIGDGMDTYESGIISAVNQSAKKCGIVIGERAKDAAHKMLTRIGR